MCVNLQYSLYFIILITKVKEGVRKVCQYAGGMHIYVVYFLCIQIKIARFIHLAPDVLDSANVFSGYMIKLNYEDGL